MYFVLLRAKLQSRVHQVKDRIVDCIVLQVIPVVQNGRKCGSRHLNVIVGILIDHHGRQERPDIRINATRGHVERVRLLRRGRKDNLVRVRIATVPVGRVVDLDLLVILLLAHKDDPNDTGHFYSFWVFCLSYIESSSSGGSYWSSR